MHPWNFSDEGELAIHEINNPLAIVIGRTELILSDLGEHQSPLKDQLETVLRSARRCNTALNDLLASSVTSDR